MFLRQNRLETAFDLENAPGEIDDGLLLTQFLRAKDQGAFELLIHRHGPMILGTCLRILANRSDAEDAFQAVFLVLIQKASQLTHRKTIGDWLYGVACKTSLKARYLANKRRIKESTLPPPKKDQAQEDNLREILDEELIRLPDKYREAIVLCDLDNLPRKDVANRLGIPEGTLSSRLTAGRKMLGERLSRKGIILPAIGLATLGTALSPKLMANTLHNAGIMTGETLGTMSPAILEMARWNVGWGSFLSQKALLSCLFATILFGSLLGNGILYFSRNEKPEESLNKTTFYKKISQTLDLANGKFSYYGMGPGRAITIQDNEIRMEFSPEAGTGHLGLWGTMELSGDFTLEANFEIQKGPDEVSTGYGTSVGLMVETGKPWGAVNVQRGIFPNLGQQLATGRQIPEEDRMQYTRESISFPSKKGQMAIRKRGNQIIVLGGESSPAIPRELKRFYCPNPLTRGMAFFADPGGSGKEFQCRLFDIRWEGLVGGTK